MKISKNLDLIKGVLTVEMNTLLTRLKKEGRNVINLGVGDPDFSPPESIRRVLRDAVDHPDYHHYPSFYPLQPLKEAIAGWYQRRFQVDLNSNSEVLPLLGSTDGLFNIHLCLLDPGDTALIPDPCYPSYESAAKLAGGQVERFPLLREDDFLPDLDAIPTETARKAKLIWVNYPNNPTGAAATPEFYRKLVSWAKAYDVAVVSDNAYSEVYFDNRPPVSFLEYPGAKEVGVELHSLSKSFNCCGWRIGMMVGNKDLIEALSKVKAHSDRGMFYPLQLTAIEALQSSADFMKERWVYLQGLLLQSSRRSKCLDAARFQLRKMWRRISANRHHALC
ncbi:MAG: LL-diaminopimelate aminotransferase apoenzyme [Deltaproteobacteria bacterium]|nr:LL-diaminopimelate aminotransferase apoenzyme [Deltaproteobacteria bacterium]